MRAVPRCRKGCAVRSFVLEASHRRASVRCPGLHLQYGGGGLFGGSQRRLDTHSLARLHPDGALHSSGHTGAACEPLGARSGWGTLACLLRIRPACCRTLRTGRCYQCGRAVRSSQCAVRRAHLRLLELLDKTLVPELQGLDLGLEVPIAPLPVWTRSVERGRRSRCQ